ncbi:MAG: GAF domain-containing sensor histidine kinase [Thermodesulfobacteriota bacterium]
MIYSDLRKLSALYEVIKEGETHLRLQEFMDSAARNAAQIMGVKAYAIKLLDSDHKNLRFASTYGLSEDYVSRGPISLEKSGVNRKVIEGSLFSIGQIDEDRYFQYPEDVQREGITSMLCLPLRVDVRIFGVFCVYSKEPDHFKESDIGFFSLMTDLIALTMDRITRERAKTWFMNKAAHQLRSPLNTIASMLRLLEGQYLGPLNDQQKETVGRCQVRLSILQAIVNDLLKIAAERQEMGPPRLEPVDLVEILQALEPGYKVQAAEKNINLTLEIQDGLPRVLAQESLLDEVFSNLISNAVKYTPSGGRVWVRLNSPLTGIVSLEVEDTGIGIAETDQVKLFSEFFRAQNAKALVEAGTGLGLVIVKDVIERLGGMIRLESRLGQGTRVIVQLPAAV